METQEYPNCCGIMILSDFGYTHTTGGLYGAVEGRSDWLGRNPPPTKERIKEFVQNCLNDYKDYAIISVALNEEQDKEIGPIFQELGFKEVSKGLNSHHDNWIVLYTYCNTEFFSYEEDYDEDEEY